MKLTSKLAATFAALALATTAQAVVLPGINGSISFSSSTGGDRILLDTSSLATATAVTNWGSPIVDAASGDLAGLAGSSATFTPFVFGSGVSPLWTVGAFSFNLTSSFVEFQSANSISIVGSGVMKSASYKDTPGSFFLTINPPSILDGRQQLRFSYSAGTQSVPDGGATLALLGVSFLGLGGVSRLVRRK
jgi:VPDSG-CTERM motif